MGICSLFGSPQYADAIVPEIAHQWRYDRYNFEIQARLQTQRFALPNAATEYGEDVDDIPEKPAEAQSPAKAQLPAENGCWDKAFMFWCMILVIIFFFLHWLCFWHASSPGGTNCQCVGGWFSKGFFVYVNFMIFSLIEPIKRF